MAVSELTAFLALVAAAFICASTIPFAAIVVVAVMMTTVVIIVVAVAMKASVTADRGTLVRPKVIRGLPSGIAIRLESLRDGVTKRIGTVAGTTASLVARSLAVPVRPVTARHSWASQPPPPRGSHTDTHTTHA